MRTKTMAGATVELSDDGYFADPSQWNHEIANEIAGELNITLTDKHFEVLEFLRARYLNGDPLTIRRVGKSGIVSIKEFYDLFPGGPLKVSSRLAGIPKPASCV